jgi:hypothetical protein
MEKKCSNCGKENPASSRFCAGCGHELPRNTTQIVTDAFTESPIKAKGTNRKIFSAIAGAICFVGAYFGVQKIFFQAPSLDKIMMESAGEINKTCPIMVDAETRLDNAIALPDNIFQYNYTLINVADGNLDTEKARAIIEDNLINMVKTNPQMKFQRDNKTTLNYNYKDKTGKFLFLIAVTPDKYK